MEPGIGIVSIVSPYLHNVRNVMHADAAGVAFFDEVSDKSRIYAIDFPCRLGRYVA
jgi:hypothetical protein